jgi:cysteinyl-tRNA synthetase
LLKLYNSLTRKIETFEPQKNKTVKMYTCGPSTYQRPHIGNHRTFLFEDVLQRYLEYLGYEVTRLITLTNIEDKAIDYAEAAGISVEELTNRNENIFFKEFEQLHIKRPKYTIRASTIVDESVKLLQLLMKKKIAYKYNHEGAQNIYYDPLKFKDFGKLAHLDMSKWPKNKRRFHQDTYPGTPWNKGDFILWHGCTIGDKVCWETEIGKGRPAWNIQDAAMITKHLGYTIDIACGGIDNLVRHHDYTVAVTEGISGKDLSKYWLHGGHLLVNGKKMSKSKGNVLYLNDIADKNYESQHLRFFLIYGNYRKKQNFTWKKLEEAKHKLNNLRTMIKNIQKAKSTRHGPEAEKIARNINKKFQDRMNNNLDIKAAYDQIYEDTTNLHSIMQKKQLSSEDATIAVKSLQEVDQVLQVIF